MISILIFFAGAMFGSFFNMLIYRLPNGVSLTNPKRSICPKCNSVIKWYHNIPIISYLFLKGKCGYCGVSIPPRYLFVELITAFVTLAVFAKFGLSLEFVLYTLVFYLLIILSFIDFDFKAVPDYLLILVLLSSLASQYENLLQALTHGMLFAGGIVLLELFVTYYIQNIKSKITKDKTLEDQKALGDGDIPIVASIGVVLGVELGMVALFLAALFAMLPSVYNKIFQNDIETPFIPYLSLGFLSAFLFGEKILFFL